MDGCGAGKCELPHCLCFWLCKWKTWLIWQPGSHTKLWTWHNRIINTARRHTHEHIFYVNMQANELTTRMQWFLLYYSAFLGSLWLDVWCASYSILITSSYINLQLILCVFFRRFVYSFSFCGITANKKTPRKTKQCRKMQLYFFFAFCMFDAFSSTLRLVKIDFFSLRKHCSPFQPCTGQ